MGNEKFAPKGPKRDYVDMPNRADKTEGSKAILDLGDNSVFISDIESIGVDLQKATPRMLDAYARALAYYRLNVLSDIPKKEAYRRVYGKPPHGEITKQLCYSLEQKKSYKHVAKAFSADYFIMFSAERIKMLHNLYNISMDEDVHTRDRVSAGDTFLKHTEVKNHELDPEQRDNQNEALMELFKGIESSIYKSLPEVGGTLEDIMVLPEHIDMETENE